MFRNYLKIAYRNLLKNKFYSLINIVGLAVGVSCCLLIALFVQDELSYDRHHSNIERIYRVTADINFGGNHAQYAVVSAPMAETLVAEYPEVENAGRFRAYGSSLIKVTDNNGQATTYKEDEFAFADPAILDVLSIPLVKGNKITALAEPSTLIISESTSRKYFGVENPLERMVVLGNNNAYKITGVFKDIPGNTHYHFQVLASMESLKESKEGIWLSHNYNTYIRLAENANPKTLEDKFPKLVEKYLYPQAVSIMGLDIDETEESPIKYFLQPLKDIHLHSNLQAELSPNGDIKYVYIFSAIAVFILVIACINFINLSTARSSKRAKEVGIRKVVGSEKKQLIAQFLAESFFLGLLGLLLGLLLVEIFLPYFNALSGKTLAVNYLENQFFVVAAFLLLMLIGLLAGAYPSFFLSSFHPAKVLKGGLVKGSSSSAWLRSGLVIFQFAVSIILIVGTTIIYRQLDYIQQKSLGFNKEQVIIIHDASGLGNQIHSFKQELLAHPQIVSASFSSFLPVRSSRSSNPYFTGGTPTDENSVSMQSWQVDHDYISTLRMELLEGRNFIEGSVNDSSSIILNESAIKKFGFKHPIGERIFAYDISSESEGNSDDLKAYTIIGIVKDFHFSSFKENITPLGFMLGQSTGNLILRIKSDQIADLVSYIEGEWNRVAPGQPFDYGFLDQKFSQMYHAEARIGKITAVFTFIAIFIACLGLFALAAFTAEQRTKEIGVRKILGATVYDVVLMLSKDFSKLVAVSFVISVPVSWWIMSSWLEGFAYRINMGIEVFIISGILAFLTAWFTISYQSVKAALVNPVQSLKSE